MVSLEEVAAMLDLPTAEDVADLLRARGAKGEREKACNCPISRFAHDMTNRHAVVWPERRMTDDWRIRFRGDNQTIRLPQSAGAFARRFDDEDPAFADLVAS